MAAVWQKAWPILLAVLFFGFIIFSHELGHFIIAKLSGVKVNEFALGMGPRLFGFTKGETMYSFRLFPIGGYCAMEGEDEESDNPRAFNNAKIWKRMIIIIAGAVMNIILGFLLMFVYTVQADGKLTVRLSAKANNPTSFARGDGIGIAIALNDCVMGGLDNWTYLTATEEGAGTEKSIQKEMELVKQLPASQISVEDEIVSEEKRISPYRNGILVASIILIVYGFLCGGTVDVLAKAINICTECIGLG